MSMSSMERMAKQWRDDNPDNAEDEAATVLG